MTTYTDNYRIPHLDQNIAQPEVPENTAKEIIDRIMGGKYTYNFTADADYSIPHVDDPTQPTDWQNGLIEITDTGVLLTATRSIILPNNTRTYIFINNTAQSITFKVSGQTGATLNSGENMYAICNGTDIIRMNFIITGAGTTYLGMTDTPSSYTGEYGSVPIVNVGENALEWYDLSAKLNSSGGTITNYGETLNAESATSGTIDIDTIDGNVITMTITSATTLTFTTTHVNTSFTLLLTNANTNVTWPTIKWEGGIEPTWSTTGEDLVTLTRINSVWYGGALIGMS